VRNSSCASIPFPPYNPSPNYLVGKGICAKRSSYSLRHLQLFPLIKTVVLVRVLCGCRSSKIPAFNQGIVFQPSSCAGFCAGKFNISGPDGLLIFSCLAYYLT